MARGDQTKGEAECRSLYGKAGPSILTRPPGRKPRTRIVEGHVGFGYTDRYGGGLCTVRVPCLDFASAPGMPR